MPEIFEKSGPIIPLLSSFFGSEIWRSPTVFQLWTIAAEMPDSANLPFGALFREDNEVVWPHVGNLL